MKRLVALALLFWAISASAQEPFPPADAGRAVGQDYDDFRQSVEKVIADATTAAASDAERADIRTLQFLLRELNQQISAGDWKRAADVKNRMQVALTRSRAVAADGPRRKAEQDRIDAERAQRERQRQDEKKIRAEQVGSHESAGFDEPAQVRAVFYAEGVRVRSPGLPPRLPWVAIPSTFILQPQRGCTESWNPVGVLMEWWR